MSREIEIRPEFSALGPGKGPSPALPRALAALRSERQRAGLPEPQSVAEYGCGLLRNVPALDFPILHAIDTEFQLSRLHRFGEFKGSLAEYAKSKFPHRDIRVIKAEQLSVRKIDAVFCINVLDVVPPLTRTKIVRHMAELLRDDSQLVLIVPRNDSRTLKLCASAEPFADGFVFRNHGVHTFYRNWQSEDLKALLRRAGLSVLKDASIYRHAVLIAART